MVKLLLTLLSERAFHQSLVSNNHTFSPRLLNNPPMPPCCIPFLAHQPQASKKHDQQVGTKKRTESDHSANQTAHCLRDATITTVIIRRASRGLSVVIDVAQVAGRTYPCEVSTRLAPALLIRDGETVHPSDKVVP